jgi:hypothetical protein
MRKIIGAAAFVAMVFTALPASAQPNDPYDYPYCLQGKDYGLPGLCQFTSYLQCQATAYGTFSYCGTNPRFAYGRQPRGRRLATCVSNRCVPKDGCDLVTGPSFWIVAR